MTGSLTGKLFLHFPNLTNFEFKVGKKIDHRRDISLEANIADQEQGHQRDLGSTGYQTLEDFQEEDDHREDTRPEDFLQGVEIDMKDHGMEEGDQVASIHVIMIAISVGHLRVLVELPFPDAAPHTDPRVVSPPNMLLPTAQTLHLTPLIAWTTLTTLFTRLVLNLAHTGW